MRDFYTYLGEEDVTDLVKESFAIWEKLLFEKIFRMLILIQSIIDLSNSNTVDFQLVWIKKAARWFMNLLEEIKVLIFRFFNGQESKVKEMKRVFQWRRYLEWKDLTPEEKLSAKRVLLIPVFAYLIIVIFNQNFSLIVLFLIGYVLYKKFERPGIEKK